MRGYGQFCPVAKAAEVFAERWMPLVLRELLCGSKHFNDLHRGVPLMSRSLLTERLRRLEEIGAVVRKRGEGGSTYHLTEAGREFGPIIKLLGTWGHRWYRTKFASDELDVGLLMWDMRRVVRFGVLPPGRTTVELIFSDQAAAKRHWWLVSDGGEIDLCPKDPGFDVGLYVRTDLRTMTRVWMGDVAVPAAIRSGSIELTGQRDIRRRFEQWLGLSSFAPIQGARRLSPKPTAAVRRLIPEQTVQIPN